MGEDYEGAELPREVSRKIGDYRDANQVSLDSSNSCCRQGAVVMVLAARYQVGSRLLVVDAGSSRARTQTAEEGGGKVGREGKKATG